MEDLLEYPERSDEPGALDFEAEGGDANAGFDRGALEAGTVDASATIFDPSACDEGVGDPTSAELDDQGRSSGQDKPELLPEHTIFLSHSGKQKGFVEQLNLDLEQAHRRPFFDQKSHSLPIGKEFPELITRAASQCLAAVVVLSEDFLTSKWPMKELITFVEAMKQKPKPTSSSLKSQKSLKNQKSSLSLETGQVDATKRDGAKESSYCDNPKLTLVPLFFLINVDQMKQGHKRGEFWKKLLKQELVRKYGNHPIDDFNAAQYAEAEKKLKGFITKEQYSEAIAKLSGTNGLQFEKSGRSETKYRNMAVKSILSLVPRQVTVDTSGIEGYKRLCKDIKGKFKEKNGCYYLGLYGKSGLGKSTICCEAMIQYFQLPELRGESCGRYCRVRLESNKAADIGADEKSAAQSRKRQERLRLAIEQLFGLHKSLSKGKTEREYHHDLKSQLKLINEPVFLVVDNVSEHSRDEAIWYASLSLPSKSYVLVTSRSSEILETILGVPGCSYPFPNMTKQEAMKLFLFNGLPRDEHHPPEDTNSELSPEEVKIFKLSSEETQVLSLCVSKCKIDDQFIPRLLTKFASFLREKSKGDESILSWTKYFAEADAGILGLEYDRLDNTSKLIFLDLAIFLKGLCFTHMDFQTDLKWKEHNNVKLVVDFIAMLHHIPRRDAEKKIKNLQGVSLLKESETKIEVPDDYLDFASSKVNRSDGEEKKWCMVCSPDYDKDFADGVVRVSLTGVRFDYDLYNLPKWRTVTLLSIESVRNLPILDLQGMRSLRVLRVKECSDVEKIVCTCNSSSKDGLFCYQKERGCMLGLQVVQLEDLLHLKEASFTMHSWRLETLWFFDCPNLACFPDVEFCRQLKRLRLPCGDFDDFEGLSNNKELTELAFQWETDTVRNFNTATRKKLLDDVMNFTNLEILDIVDEREVYDWIPMGSDLNVSKLRRLTFLDLSCASKVQEVKGLEELSDSLTSLALYGCCELLKLPDLIRFKKLKWLCIGHCHKLDLSDADGFDGFEPFHAAGETCAFGDHECLDTEEGLYYSDSAASMSEEEEGYEQEQEEEIEEEIEAETEQEQEELVCEDEEKVEEDVEDEDEDEEEEEEEDEDDSDAEDEEWGDWSEAPPCPSCDKNKWSKEYEAQPDGTIVRKQSEPWLAPPKLLPKHRIYVLHSKEERPFVERLCGDLMEFDHFPFFDPRYKSLPIAQENPELIKRAARKCLVVVIVLSEELLTSKWSMKELIEFVEATKAGPPNKPSSRPNNKLKLFPLFYEKNPDDLKEDCRKALWEKLVKKHGKFPVEKRKYDEALDKVLENIENHGLHMDECQIESKYRREVVSRIRTLVPPVLIDISAVHAWERLSKDIFGMFSTVRKHQESNEEVECKYTRLGLHGMPGVGKTTICCEAMCYYYQVQYGGSFCTVRLDNDKDAKGKVVPKRRLARLMTAIKQLARLDINLLGIMSEEEGREELTQQLRKIVQPVLLVVDNISDISLEEAKWYASVMLPPNSHVVLTSRSREILENVLTLPHDCIKAFPALKPKEAEGLFLSNAFPSSKPLSGLQSIERKILQDCLSRCQIDKLFIPRLLTTFASFLHNRTKGDILRWKEYIGNGSNILDLMYDHLDKLSRLIFLDLAFFASDMYFTHMDFYAEMESNGQTTNFKLVVDFLAMLHGIPFEDAEQKVKHLQGSFLEVSETKILISEDYRELAFMVLKRTEEKKWCMLCINVDDDDDDDDDEEDMECFYDMPDEDSSGLVRVALYGVEFDGDLHRTPEWKFVTLLTIYSVQKLPILDLQGLRSMRVLMVQECDDIEEIVCTYCNSYFLDGCSCHEKKRGCLHELRVVQLEYLPHLKHASFPMHCRRLETLWFYECPNLVCLPNLQFCKMLKRLRLPCGDFNGFEGLSSNKALIELAFHWNPHTVRNFNVIMRELLLEDLMGLTNLKVLDIVDEKELYDWIPVGVCPNVRKLVHLTFLDLSCSSTILKVEGLEALSELTSLGLYGCCELRELPILNSLKKLRWLCIGHCHKLPAQSEWDDEREPLEAFHALAETCSFGEHECLECEPVPEPINVQEEDVDSRLKQGICRQCNPEDWELYVAKDLEEHNHQDRVSCWEPFHIRDRISCWG